MITLRQKLKAIEREIALRKNVYAKRVDSGKLRQEDADYEIAVMQSIADDYRARIAAAEHGP